jgi:hypothetical protein
MKKTLLIVFALALAVGTSAQDKTVTIAGILMDKSCAVEMKMDAQGHDKDCALMPDCVKSGYGVVTTGGKFVKFDANGDKQVAAWLKATKLKTNLQITVTGTMDKDILKVATLK